MKSSSNKIYKWFILLLNVFLLAFVIYFFILGTKLNNGGLDGLSLLTVQFLDFAGLKQIEEQNKETLIIFLIFLYNIISFIFSYKFFGKEFSIRIFFLAIFLNFSLFFLDWCIGINKRDNFLSWIDLDGKYKITQLFISSVIAGLFIGYTMSNIRKIGYNTGGMDIFQKILKDVYKINFIWVLLITDGIIIFLSSLLESKRDFIYFLVRIGFSLFSLVIVGFIMEKNSIIKKDSNKNI